MNPEEAYRLQAMDRVAQFVQDHPDATVLQMSRALDLEVALVESINDQFVRMGAALSQQMRRDDRPK